MPKKILSKSSATFFVALAVILLLIFFNFKGWLEVPKNVVYYVFSPFLKSFQWVGSQARGGWKIITTVKDLNADNYRLSRENSRLWQENSTLKEAARENEILRQRLDIGLPPGHKFILANIIGSNLSAGQFFLIDKGEMDGVSSGLAAVTAENFLVGKITEIGKRHAKMILVSDGNSAINALTQDTRVSGIVKGVHGLGLVMDMIPIDKEIKIGETILTSGKNDFLPSGLIIGTVSGIDAKEADIYKKAIIQPVVDFNDLEKVFILTP